MKSPGEIKKGKIAADINVHTTQKWISAEDDIPTDDYDVLAWVGNKEIAIAWFDGYTGEWHAYGSYEGEVTHWMPLPEPPKEDE